MNLLLLAIVTACFQPADPAKTDPKPGPAPSTAPAPATAPAAPPAAPASPAPGKGEPAKPKAEEKPAFSITVDCEEAPDLKAWGERAAKICEAQWPKLLEDLKSEGFTPTDRVTIVFKKEMKAPASTTGNVISVNVKHVKAHREDYGMMVHELVHVVQAYPRHRENLGWLTEGIADYERFWKYEPQARQPAINVEKASYRDAYRTSAAFLGFVALKYDKNVVTKLNARMRKRDASEAMFKEVVGKPAEELWKEFIAAGAPSSPEAQKAWAEKEKEGEGKK